MKTMILFFLFTIFSLAALASEKVKINGKLYIANGYDDNDHVELTVVGVLPDSCYTHPDFEIERKDKKLSIRLFAQYSKKRGGCRDVSVPHTEVINFGMMYAGEYEISLVNKHHTEVRSLSIKPASTELVDEFLYGNVSGIIENDANREIQLIGANPVSCLVFDKMITDIQNSIIVLKPQFREEGICEMKSTPFKINYNIPYLENQTKGILLHVRLMNGRSYNYLYQNRL